MPVDLDMIVGCDSATVPARKNIWLFRQCSQLKPVDLDEEFGAAGAKTDSQSAPAISQAASIKNLLTM
jgi:hypothetical protein